MKPKLVIVNCSGGGLRAAMWANYVLQETNRDSKGAAFTSTHLITGASGGMVGAAYFRAIYQYQGGILSKKQGEDELANISRDLLNNVTFNLVSHDLFLRYRKFEVNGEKYLKDRGMLLKKNST
jgi:hypothetical protein